MTKAGSAKHPRKDLKGASHHYFPKVLQRYWGNEGGWVHRLSADGSFKASKSGSFGHIRNAHHIKLAENPSPWDESFEYTFAHADDSFPQVVELLGTLECEWKHRGAAWCDRFTPQWHLANNRLTIAECVTSLVVRSPSVRNLIRVSLEGFWEGKGPWPEGKAPASLISVNQKHLLEDYSKTLASRGKFVVLLSESREFIFGDGMLHNFVSGMPPGSVRPRCIVPILPTVAIAYDCPTSHTAYPEFMSVVLDSNEIDEINNYSLVYSCDHIFFRNEFPRELHEFFRGQHRIFQYNRTDLFDSIMSAAANAWFDKPPV